MDGKTRSGNLKQSDVVPLCVWDSYRTNKRPSVDALDGRIRLINNVYIALIVDESSTSHSEIVGFHFYRRCMYVLVG